MAPSRKLSSKTIAVLSLIADGHSYSQIVEGHLGVTYADIFEAAREALDLNQSEPNYDERMAKIRSIHPNAYTKWTDEENERLAKLKADGMSLKKISEKLGRQPSAIRSQLIKKGIE